MFLLQTLKAFTTASPTQKKTCFHEAPLKKIRHPTYLLFTQEATVLQP